MNALGRVWNDETASKLIVLLEGGSEDVRKEAALSLGRIGGDEAIAALFEALAHDTSPEVRWRVAMMIGCIGGTVAISLLEDILKVETHPLVIGYIVGAIEALVPP